MSKLLKQLETINAIEQHFIQKRNPYVPEDTRESIRFKNALSFGLLFGTASVLLVKIVKKTNSPAINKLMIANMIGATAIRAWMVNDIRNLKELIPPQQLQQKMRQSSTKNQQEK